MITNFKIFENTNPEIGDYIIINNIRSNSTELKKLNNFLKNKIGKIIDINQSTHKKIFTIDYGFDSAKKIPTLGLLHKFFYQMHVNDSDYNYCFKSNLIENEFIFAKTKNELIIKMKVKKYNI